MHENLKYLFIECTSRELIDQKNSRIIIPIFSFINQIISSLKHYLKEIHSCDWADYLLDQTKPANNIAVITCSWIENSKNSLECQLLATFLKNSQTSKLRLYNRLRKYITQLMNIDMLDEITLKHQDAMTIIHRMFSSPQIKKQILRGIKQIFVSFKVAEARIYASVFIEYILSLFDSLDDQARMLMCGQSNSTVQGISDLSSISNFSSNLHKENGLYKSIEKTNTFKIIDQRFASNRHKREKETDENEPKFSYYSNSSNNSSALKPDNFGSKRKQKLNDIKLLANNEPNFYETRYLSIREPMKSTITNSSNFKKQIIVEDEKEHELEWQKQNKDQNQNQKINYLVERNRDFKNKMLQSRAQSYEDTQIDQKGSIQQAINIIHNSIVRHQRNIF